MDACGVSLHPSPPMKSIEMAFLWPHPVLRSSSFQISQHEVQQERFSFSECTCHGNNADWFVSDLISVKNLIESILVKYEVVRLTLIVNLHYLDRSVLWHSHELFNSLVEVNQAIL